MTNNPFAGLPDISTPRFEDLNPKVYMPDPPARSAYDRISKMIAEFEANLDPDQEVGICVVGAPGNEQVHVTGLGYWGPDLIRFFGSFPDGRSIEIIQNVSQINVMLIAVPKMGDEAVRIAENTGQEE